MASEAGQVSGSLFGAYGSIVQGQQTSSLLDNHAREQRQNATLAVQAAQYNANRQQILSGKRIGAETAAFGASGVTMDSGSVLSVLGDSAASAELDRLNIIHGGDVRAINYQNQASLDEYAAKNALQASYWNAASSIAMGGSKAFGSGSGKTSTTADPNAVDPNAAWRSNPGAASSMDTGVGTGAGYGAAGGATSDFAAFA